MPRGAHVTDRPAHAAESSGRHSSRSFSLPPTRNVSSPFSATGRDRSTGASRNRMPRDAASSAIRRESCGSTVLQSTQSAIPVHCRRGTRRVRAPRRNRTRVGQHREDDLPGPCRFRRGGCRASPVHQRQPRRACGSRPRAGMPAAEEVGRHAAAHDPQSDEPHLHPPYPFIRRFFPRRQTAFRSRVADAGSGSLLPPSTSDGRVMSLP